MSKHAAETWTKNGREYWKCSCGGWERAFTPGDSKDPAAVRLGVVQSFREHARG